MAEALTLRVTQRESRLVVAVGSIWALTSWTDANGRVMLASGGDDGTIRRWDASTGEVIGEPLVVEGGPVAALAICTDADGRVLLVSGGGDGTIRRWDAGTGAPVGEPMTGHTDRVQGLTAWSDLDGHVLLASGGTDETVRCWDATTGVPAGNPLKTRFPILALTSWTAPDGRAELGAGCRQETVRRWDAATGRRLRSSARGYLGMWLAIAGSAYRYFTRYGGSRPYKKASGLNDVLYFIREQVSLAAYTAPNGRAVIAAGLKDGTIRRWDASTGTPIGKAMTGHTDWVRALTAWTGPDGRPMLASGSDDGTIRRWDASAGTLIGKAMTGHTDCVRALTAWTGLDGRLMLASAGDDGTIRRWDATTGRPVGERMTGHTRPVFSLAAWTGSDGYPMLASAATADRRIQRWNASTGSPVADPLPMVVPASQPLTAWTDRDGRTVLAAGSTDGTVRCWDADTGTPVGAPLRIAKRSERVTVLASWTGPDGCMMLSAEHDDGRIVCWDVSASRRIGKPFGRSLFLTRLVRLLDRVDLLPTALLANLLRRLLPTDVTDPVTATTTQRGQVLVSGGDDGTIRYWDVSTGRKVGIRLTGHAGAVRALTAWTGPDGPMLASGGDDGTIRRWDAEAGEKAGTPLTGHAGAVRALTAWTGPDGPMLASGGDDGTIRRWDAEAGTEAGAPLTGHVGGVVALTTWTGADGRVMLVSGGRDGVIQVWDTITGALLSPVLVEPIRLRGLADRPAARDLLDRKPLTQALASLLLWRPTAAGGETGPNVVTIEGRWGTGKTTIMRLAESRIRAKPERNSSDRRLSVAAARKILRRAKVRDIHVHEPEPREYRGALTAWFNPWVCQSSEQVWAGLARAITDAAEPVLYPPGAEAEAQRYWLTRNASTVDRFAVSRRMLLRIISPLLGFSVLIGIATALINLAQVNNNKLFHLGHWPITLGLLALGIAIILLLLGLAHTARRYYGPANTFLPADLITGPVLSGSYEQNAAETAKILRDPIYVQQSGYLPIVQADTARTVKDLRNAGYDLIVFIDDLDRCSARTTAEVFEAVNLFLSGTTDLEAKFVIGLDPAVVAAHLDAAYRDLGDTSLLQYGDDPSAGWAFLRKVVQLPVGAPYVTDAAIDQFLSAALDAPTGPANTRAVAAGSSLGGQQVQRAAGETQPLGPAQPDQLSGIAASCPRTHIRTGSLEHQPEIVALMAQRLEAQPDRSAREAKRMLNVWQLYQRVLDRVNPLRDDEEIVRRACHLFILAEVITRWPALQQQLNQSWQGRRGLQILAAACTDDEQWLNAVKVVGLDEGEYSRAVGNLRELLRAYNGTAVADLAAQVL
jgi:WD40 repeat protein